MSIQSAVRWIAAAMATAFGCVTQPLPGKVTGGGSLPSASGVEGEKAHVGFTAQQCDYANDSSLQGQLQYIDDYAPGFDGGVSFHAVMQDIDNDGIAVALCVENGGTTNACNLCATALGRPVYAVELAYSSTNPRYPGDGAAGVCLRDLGEGRAGGGDLAAVGVLSGPYAIVAFPDSYVNVGPFTGNVQGHDCPDAGASP